MRRHGRTTEFGGTQGVVGTATESPRGQPAAAPVPRVHVRDVMARDLVVLPAWLGLEILFGEPRRPRHAAYPVIDAAGALVGVVDPAALAASGASGPRTVGEICRPLSSVAVVGPDDDVDELRGTVGALDDTGALVVQAGRLVGAISPGYLRRLARARAGLAP